MIDLHKNHPEQKGIGYWIMMVVLLVGVFGGLALVIWSTATKHNFEKSYNDLFEEQRSLELKANALQDLLYERRWKPEKWQRRQYDFHFRDYPQRVEEQSRAVREKEFYNPQKVPRGAKPLRLTYPEFEPLPPEEKE